MSAAAGLQSHAWPALAGVLQLADLSPAARPFVVALVEHPQLPLHLAKLAQMLRGREQRKDARLVASAARALASDDIRVRVLTEWICRRQAPLWHFGIVHDQLRNEAYARALRHHLRPGMTVFEIGTGTGILAMLAVQAGAQHVYTCEMREDVAAAAREIVARNGMADRITVIGRNAHDVRLGIDLPERADLFVSEIVDNSLLGEHVLPLTELARAHFLKPGAPLLPWHVAAMGCLVSGRQHHEQYRMERVMGFDLTPFNRFTPLELNAGKGGGGDVEMLSEPVELLGFDLRRDAPTEASHALQLVASREGRAEALMRWLRLDFGDGIVFENRPPQRSSWDPHLHILPRARDLKPGQTLDFEISHDRSRLYVIPSMAAASRP